jgi:hypothetical protein
VKKKLPDPLGHMRIPADITPARIAHLKYISLHSSYRVMLRKHALMIAHFIADMDHVSFSLVVSGTRNASIVRTRQRICYAIHSLFTELSTTDIGLIIKKSSSVASHTISSYSALLTHDASEQMYIQNLIKSSEALLPPRAKSSTYLR